MIYTQLTMSEEKNTLMQYENTRIAENHTYPHKFNTTCTFKEYIEKYNSVDDGSRHRDKVESIAGRILEIRTSGKKLVFITMISNGLTLQVISHIDEYKGSKTFAEANNVCRGDIVGIKDGFVGKSHKGELSIFTTNEIIMLTPCHVMLTKQYFGISDTDFRVKNRWMDMISNPSMLNTLKTRSKIINYLRQFLLDDDYVEVETPVISRELGGAAAKPFITYHNDLKEKMYMRIAPELFLKKLVVGGIDRVFEIGKQFRNEGLDTTHQAEFTSMECYKAYADYNDMIQFCEDMMSYITKKVTGDLIIKYMHNNKEVELDFLPPYRRIDIVKELEKQTGVTFPSDLNNSHDFFDDLCKKKEIECSDPRTTSRLIDKLIAHYIEPQCINPTFVMNHPKVMSPLAKGHRTNPNLTERFELFVCGMELANAYTELNNHIVQKERLQEQLQEKKDGNDEAHNIDDSFINALKCGLPPTGGFGLGVDRFVMLLTNNLSIRDVIAFPM